MIGSSRRARAADLEQVADIFFEAEVGDDPNPPPRRGVPSCFRHELETGEMYVVEDDGQIVAFATLITRGSVAYLAELFVRRDRQSSGIGGALLRQVLPREARVCCTSSSTDRRALALYVRAGLRPRWPSFWLRAESASLANLPARDVDLVEARVGDPDLVRWDARVGRRRRPLDHTYWVEQTGAVPLWFRRQGHTVGYGYVQMRSDDSPWHPEAATLGPIGALDPDAAEACVAAAVGWARSRAEVLRIAVPGPHPVLATLLGAGFRITYVETFLSTATSGLPDFRRYIPSGSWLQ